MLYAHHVGGRAGTVAFPDVGAFAGQVHTVLYEADESCVPEIAARWAGKPATVLPFCLADGERQVPFFVNVCPFTSSLFAFNSAFGQCYEEKGRPTSDYVFEANFAPRREVTLSTRSIDALFGEGQIPRVDFLSLDTQGGELAILSGASQMIATETVCVSSEVSFAALYQNAPLFGDVDAFLRERGFLLAGLSTMSFGYKRIPQAFRGEGIPLQGEALYFLRPERITNADPAVRQRRLTHLAFCALAFGFTEIAFDAVERATGIGGLGNDPISAFLLKFQQKIRQVPELPPLWHELPDSVQTPGAGGQAAGSLPTRAWRRLMNDPAQFSRDVRRVAKRSAAGAAIRLNRLPLMFNEFERFLFEYGFERAATSVCLRRIA